MGILKVTVWSLCCVGAGMFLAGYEIKGKTAIEYAKDAAHVTQPKLVAAKEKVEDVADDVRKHVAPKEARPTERHSEADRDAIDQLIAKRAH